jgi:hypothetical protein
MLIVVIAGVTGSGKTSISDIPIPTSGKNHIGLEVLISIIKKHILKSKL